jgi:hypothetical protein
MDDHASLKPAGRAPRALPGQDGRSDAAIFHCAMTASRQRRDSDAMPELAAARRLLWTRMPPLRALIRIGKSVSVGTAS